jgi:hypothetical protein
VQQVVNVVKKHTSLSVDVTVARAGSGQVEHVQVLPDVNKDGKGMMGVQLTQNVHVVRSLQETWGMLAGTVGGLAGFFTNFDSAKEGLSGPVAVVQVGAEVARKSPAGANPAGARLS